MAGVVAPTRRREQGNRNKRFDWAISDYRLTRAGQPNNNALIVNAYHLSMGGRGSRLALFYRYFRLGGSLALPVRLLRCLIADLNLRIAGNHYWPINELLFGCSGYPGPISAFPQQNHPKYDRLLAEAILGTHDSGRSGPRSPRKLHPLQSGKAWVRTAGGGLGIFHVSSLCPGRMDPRELGPRDYPGHRRRLG